MKPRGAQIHAVADPRRPNHFALLISYLGCLCAVILTTACDPRSILMSSMPQAATAAPSFSLSISPNNLTVDQGAGESTTITVGAQNGFAEDVMLFATELPSGIVAEFSPAVAGTQSMLNLTATATANPGVYEIAVAGVAGSLAANSTVTLTVLPSPSFSLSAAPNSLTFEQGSGGTTTITVDAQNGFKDSVSLYAMGLPKGVLASLAMAAQKRVLTLTSSDSTVPGEYTVTLSGIAGSLQATTSISVTILPSPSFRLSASPNTLTLNPGTSGSTTITVAPIDGFSGLVSLSEDGLPNGVNIAFSPTTTETMSTVNLAVSNTAVAGTYKIAVGGKAGPVREITSLTLTILPSAEDPYCSTGSPTWADLPQNWVNNTEYVGTTTNKISYPSSGAGGNWTCGPTSYGPYTANLTASLQQAVNDAESCRASNGSGTMLNVPPGLFTASSGLILPQTAGDTSSNFIVLTSTSPLTTGQTACSHGIQDNVSESTQPGIRNVGCAGTAMSYQLGTTVTAISSGAFTLANGTMTNTSDYDDIGSMFTLECSTTNCNALGTAAADANGVAPHNFAILNMEARPQAGLTGPGAIVKIGLGTETVVSQLPQHIHLAYDYVHGDWADAPVTDGSATGPAVGTNSIPNDVFLDCVTCSFMYSYIDQSLRPGAEGHGVYFGLAQIAKNAHNWIEGQSSGMFAGGYTASVPIPNFLVQDIEDRANRYTYPYSWILAKQGNFNPTQGSYTRKNSHEFKTGTRILHDGNIDENVDDSGAQNGLVLSWKTDNTSSGTGANYFIAQNNTTITNNIIRNSCNGVSVGFRSDSGAGNGGGVALPAQLYVYQNNLMENVSTSNPGCAGSTPQFGFRIGGASNSWAATPLRDPTGSFTTMTLTAAPGLGQSDFNVGDPVNVSGCSDTSFNTGQTVMGPGALVGTIPTGLTVLYTNPGTEGAGADVTGCVVTNIQGWTSQVLYNHNTDVLGGTGPGDPYSPCSAGTNPYCLARNVTFTNSIFVGGGLNSSFAEGTRTQTKAFDSTTETFNHLVLAGRSVASGPGCSGLACYTQYPGAISPPVNIYDPVANCSTSTPASTCAGFQGVMDTGTIPSVLTDWHGWALCNSSISGCSDTASYYGTGQPGQASDGTDLGISTSLIDAAEVSNQYSCSNPSGSGPYPDH